VTIGDTRPLIILPEQLRDETDENVLISAIGHEMVHVSRRDYFFNLIYELVFLPLSFHPAAMLVRRRINQTRELCCDERVAGRLLEAEEYARSLVRLAGAAANLGRPVLTTVGMGDADNLEVRVMSLLNGSVTGPNGRNYLVLAGLFVAAIVGISIGGFGFRVGIEEASAQQADKQERTEYAVSQDDDEVRKLKQAIELKQKELSQTTDESTARSLKAEIEKLKAELMIKTASRVKREFENKEREQSFIDEYKAKLSAEEPNLTEDQVKERVRKELLERRLRADQKTIEQETGEVVRMKREIEAQLATAEMESADGSNVNPVPKMVSGGVLNSRMTTLPNPAYPPAAMAVKAEGMVTVKVLIDENGNVVSATALSGHPLLRGAAEAAAKKASISPTYLGGQAVRVTGVLTYNFVMTKKVDQ